MIFKWSEYIELSEQLINNGESSDIKSAYYRTSISRSYYGVYCIAKDKVEEYLGDKVPKGDSHTFVHDKFNYSSGRIAKKIGLDLQRLHIERKKADYDASEIFEKEQAKTILKQAKSLLKLYNDPNLKIDSRH
ncbi:MAG: HEPN domain-containing protein [Nitrospirae bacterium YQR-1]